MYLRVLRLLLPLLAILGVMAWIADGVLRHLNVRWWEKDVRLRAELAMRGARESLLQHWDDPDRAGIEKILVGLAHDERIMGAAACTIELRTVARTPLFPSEFECARLGDRAGGGAWSGTTSHAGGPVHVTSFPIVDGDRARGVVVLVHDMRYADGRVASLRGFSLAAFGIVAVMAAAATLLYARLSWRRWTDEVRRLVRGAAPKRKEFQPLVDDVRELAARLAAEATEGANGRWTPERLRATLMRHLHGERVVVVANREPYIHDRAPDGSTRVLHPASGLVTALEPVMRACSGVWVAHGAGSADRETADRRGRIAVPPGEASYQLRRVWLTPEEEQGYYYGFSNEGLWPLCHIAHTRPVFRAADWDAYVRVNRKFAAAVCEEVDRDDPIVFVQDYHLALVPRLVRERLPRATILTFWHVPWPHSERLGICPRHAELVEGLLGSSLLGFHTQLHCNNFLESVDRYLEARVDRELHGVIHGGRRSLVRPYPISIEWPNRWIAQAPSVEECRAGVRRDLGLSPDTLLGVGIDRLDYTKGVEERLSAVELVLERHAHLRGRFVFAQVAAPSRTKIDRYRELNRSVEALAQKINRRFGADGWQPIVLLAEHHEPPAVFRYYRAADVCYVSSLHDGMNLVAKEFVAAREDERGVLVLSRFTGAARELTEALIVNPYDLDEAASALAAALAMSPEEQRERMRAMRELISELNVYRWAGRMLVDAARLRQHDRLSTRLLSRLRAAEGGT